MCAEKQSEICDRGSLLPRSLGQVSSQFSPGEISSIIIAWLVLSVAITYQNFVGLFTGIGSFEIVIAGFVATATGFIIHEMGHKFVAIRREIGRASCRERV